MCVLQFCLDIDEVDIAAQVFDHWRTDTSTPAYIEVQLSFWILMQLSYSSQCLSVLKLP